MKCAVHNCTRKGVVTDVVIRGKQMRLPICDEHMKLIEDVREEKALRREQAAERRRWGDPQRIYS